MSNDEPTTANGIGPQHLETKKRVNLWLKEEEYNKLRSSLIMQKMSVSEWMRSQIEEYLKQQILEKK